MTQFYLDKLKEARKLYNVARSNYIDNPTNETRNVRDSAYVTLKIARKNYQAVKCLQ